MSAGPDGEETRGVELIHRGDHPESVGFDYRGSRVILPAIGTPPKEVHPLMFWWAILYTFIRCPCSLATTRKRGRSLPTPLRPSLPCPSSTSWKWLKTQFRTCSGARWSL